MSSLDATGQYGFSKLGSRGAAKLSAAEVATGSDSSRQHARYKWFLMRKRLAYHRDMVDQFSRLRRRTRIADATNDAERQATRTRNRRSTAARKARHKAEGTKPRSTPLPQLWVVTAALSRLAPYAVATRHVAPGRPRHHLMPVSPQPVLPTANEVIKFSAIKAEMRRMCEAFPVRYGKYSGRKVKPEHRRTVFHGLVEWD